MICLCCGKPIKNKGAASCGWHHSCIKHFFGTVRLPEITISNEALEWKKIVAAPVQRRESSPNFR